MARFVQIAPDNHHEINSDDRDDMKPDISPTNDDQNNHIHRTELYSSETSDDRNNYNDQKECHSSEVDNSRTNSDGKELSTPEESYSHKNYDSDELITSDASYGWDNHDSEELNCSEVSHEHNDKGEQLDILEASYDSRTHDTEEDDYSEISVSPINCADDDQEDKELANFVTINILLHKMLDNNYNYNEHLENDLRTIGQLMTQEPVNLVVSLYDETDVLDLYFDHDLELSVYMSILLELTRKLKDGRSEDQHHNDDSQNDSGQDQLSTAPPAKQLETTKKLLDLMHTTLEKPKQNGILEDAMEFGKILSGLLALKRGADVNTQTKHYKQTLLHCIIDTLHVDGRLYESVDLEIEATNIEPMTIIEEIGLPLRAVDGKLDLFSAVEYVLSLPNNRLLQDSDGNTPLHTLVKSGQYTGQMSLIYSSSQPNEDAVRIAKMMTENRKWHELNCTNKKGVTAFMSCILHNIVEISVMLAQVSEVDVNLGATKSCKLYDYKNSLVSPQLLERVIKQWGSHKYLVPEKFTPLMACSLFDNRQVLRVLLGRKDLRTAGQAVFPCKQNPDSVISQEISVGDTHVHLAVLNDNLDQLKLLLQALGPAALNSCLNGDGYTILHRACHLKRINIMHFLLCKANVAAIFTDDDPLTDENYREFVNRCAEYGSAASVYYYGPDDVPFSRWLSKIFDITKQAMPLLKHWFTKMSGSERLRHISVEGFFNRVALAFIYTASCLTQFLLKLGFTNFCASTMSVLSNYRAFVECADYDISAVDNIGQSLLHIIANNGLAGLLVPAVKLRKINIVDFRQLDSNGKVPLEVAIHSTNVYSHKIVSELATLVKTHAVVDVCQNQVTQFTPRLIEIMSEYRNQSWFGATINNLKINNLLDIYASNKPQSFWATNTASTIELDVFELQQASTNGAGGTKLAQRWAPIKNGDLKNIISIAISQLHAMRQLTMDTSSFLKKYQILYNILREKFLQSTQEAFEFEFTKKKFKVSYKSNNELLQSYTYKVNITYKDIIKSIGKEWDHLGGNKSSTRDERNKIYPHSNDYIFQAQKVPFLQIILTQVSDAIKIGSAAALSMRMKKLQAFLQFPFIELEQSRDAVLGMSNSLECAPNEEVRNLLLNKLKTQTALSHASNSTNILSTSVDITSFVISIEYDKIPKVMDKKVYESLARGYKLIMEDVKEKVKENVKEDLSDIKLYTFAELFCWRLKPNRKNYSVDFISSTLDSLARLLEVNSVCVAVAIFEGKFYISSNFGPAFCDMKDRALIRENVILAGIHLFNYMTKLANHSQNNDDTSLNDFFTDVLATSIHSNSVNNRRFKNVFPNDTKDKLVKFLHLCFKQNNDIFKHASKDSKGDLVFDDNMQIVFCSCGHIQYENSLSTCCCKCKETLQGKELLKANWVTTILKFCRDLRKLKDAVISKNPQKRLPPAIIKALKSCIKGEDMFELISNYDYLHAESALISRIMSLKGYELQLNLNIYIGISKICCPHCALFIQTLRNLSYETDVPFFSTRGSHQSNYFWIMPRLVVDDGRILAQFLGGQESELYAYFASLSDEERIQALNIVQHFSYDKLKEYALDDLCKILRDPQTHIQHSKPEQSLTLASTLGTCDDLKDDLPDVDPDVDQEYLFMDALYSKSSSRLTELINSANWTLDINYQHPLTKMTALHVAILRDDPILVELLVKKNASTTIKDNKGMLLKQYIREHGYPKNCEIIWDILYPSYVSEREHLEKAKQDYIQSHGSDLAYTENQFGAYQIPAPDGLENSPERCLHFLNKSIQFMSLNMFQANICDLTATRQKSAHHEVYRAFKVACKCIFYLGNGDCKDNSARNAINQKSQTSDAFEIFTTSMRYIFYITLMLNTKCLSETKILHLCLQTMQCTGELETLRTDLVNMLMPGTNTHLTCPINLFAFLSYELCHQNLQDILHILEIYSRMLKKTNAKVQNFRMQLLSICLQIGTIIRHSSPKLQRLIGTEESLIQDTLAIRHAIMHINQPQYGDPICKYLGKFMPTLWLDGVKIDPEMVIQGWMNFNFVEYLNQDWNQSSSMTAAEFWLQIREEAKSDSQWGIDYLHASDCEIPAEVMDSSSISDDIIQLTLASNDTEELQRYTADLVEPFTTLGTCKRDLSFARASERRSDKFDNDTQATNHSTSVDAHIDKLLSLLKDFIFYSSQIEHLLRENPDCNPLDIEKFTSRNNVDRIWQPIHLELQFLQILVSRQTELIFREFRCLPSYLAELLENVRDDSSSWFNYCANGLYQTTLLTYRREVFFEVLFRNCHAIITASKLIQVFQYALQRNFNYEQAYKHMRSMAFKACDHFFDQLDESFSSSDNH